MFSETVEEVSSALRPLRVQTSGPFPARIVAVGDLLREVIPVLFEAIPGVQVGLLGAVRNSGEVADSEVNACRLVTGSSRCLDFVFADEVEFPASFRLVVDYTDLLQVLNRYAGARFVFDKDVFPRFRVFLVVRTLRQANAVVLGVVPNAVLLPRHRATRVFFVDATALVVVVVFLAVAGRIRSTVRLPLSVPRVEGFSEFLQNALTGLAMQSVVRVVGLQLAFQLRVVGNLARFVPLLSGVVVRNVPEFRCAPPVLVKRLLYL